MNNRILVPLITLALSTFLLDSHVAAQESGRKTLRVGIIGLDSSHAINFTKILNSGAGELAGCKVVAAYPKGSRDIEASLKRVPEYTAKLREQGIKIVDSIDDLLKEVDCVLLESNDGRVHWEQAVPVLKSRKPMFIDKPVAGSLVDTIALFDAAKHLGAPVFSSSSLRYTDGAMKIGNGSVGKIIGCDAFSPCPIEKTHPDLFWYGIHGVETLVTIMGPGCESVVRVHTDDTDVVVGNWRDGRIGTFRGRRRPDNQYQGGYGGTVFGEKGVEQIGGFGGYEPLLAKVIAFFQTGNPPVSPQETIEIYAFMEAADESKRQGGISVKIKDVINAARRQAMVKVNSIKN